MNSVTEMIVTLATLIVGVAILALIVSPKANTVGVIQAAASGFGNNLAVAEAPVTGAATNINLTYPNTSQGMYPTAQYGLGSFS